MSPLNAVFAALLVINGVFSIDFELEYSPDSLSQNGWENEGTDTGNDIMSLKGTVKTVDGVNSLCYSTSQDSQAYIDYIDYDTHKRSNPELTMIIWIRPEPGYTPQGTDWLLGHDNGGFDRSIIAFDSRYGGIAMGVGSSYGSTVSYPTAGVYTSITATFSENTGTATVYKNGGNDGEQTRPLNSNDGAETDIGLNGLRNYGNHNFVGCIAKVQIVNRVLTADEIADVYDEGIHGDPCHDVTCDEGDVCDAGECVRDCDVLDIDAFLQECSTDWTTQNAAIAAIEATMANLQVQIDGNDADIAGNAVDIGTNTGNIASNTGNIGTNTANIATNTGDIGTLQTDLNDAKTNLQGQINDNKDNIDINKGNIDTNTGNIGTNTAGVATNAAAIATNAGGIAANVASIGTNTGNIGTNTQDIAGNAADIGSNSGDIAALQSALSDLQDEVATLRKKLRRKKKQGSAAMPGVDDWDNDDAINDDEWYDNMNKPYPATNSFWDTWSWQNIGVIIVCILLMANLIFMTYNNCCNGGNKQRKRYERVGRYMDSEDVDSEANLK